MKKNTKIALLVYTALFFIITKVRQVINGLQFRFNGLQIMSSWAGGTVSTLRLNLLLRNPLPFGVTIDSIVGDVYIQGHRASNLAHDVNMTIPIEIKPSSITPVSLDITIDWGHAGFAIRDSIMSGSIESFTAVFDGVITVNGRSFNVKKTISYYDLV